MSDLENGYCPLNGHGLYGGKDRPCPWCHIAELETEVVRISEINTRLVQIGAAKEKEAKAAETTIESLRQERDYWKGYVHFIDDCLEGKALYDEHLQTKGTNPDITLPAESQ